MPERRLQTEQDIDNYTDYIVQFMQALASQTVLLKTPFTHAQR